MSSQPPPLCCSARIAQHKAAIAAEPLPEAELTSSPKKKQGHKQVRSNANEIVTKCQRGEGKGKEKKKEKKKEKEKKKKDKKQEKRRECRARRKMDMQCAAEDTAEDMKGTPEKLTLVEKWLVDKGTTITPPKHSHQEPMASSLPLCSPSQPNGHQGKQQQQHQQQCTTTTKSTTSDSDSHASNDDGANDANDAVNANNANSTCEQHCEPNDNTKSTHKPRHEHLKAQAHPQVCESPPIINAGSNALNSMASPSISSVLPHSALGIPVGPPSCCIHFSIDGEGDTVMGMPDQESVTPSTLLKQDKAIHQSEYDISNLPTPKYQPPANGSSRSWGATSHGRSQGNVHNFGDPSPAESDMAAPLPRGHANLMITNEQPSTLTVNNANSVLKVNNTLQSTETDVVDSKSASPMESSFVASVIPPSFHSHSSQSHLVSLAHTVTSHSCSPFVASTSVQEGLGSLSSGGPSKMQQDHKDLLLAFLGIDLKIPYLSFNLHNAFIKHCAILEATQIVMKLCHNEEWQALEHAKVEGQKSDNDVWGFPSSVPYTLEQLKAWVKARNQEKGEKKVKLVGSSKRQASPEKKSKLKSKQQVSSEKAKSKSKKKKEVSSSSSEQSRSPSPAPAPKKSTSSKKKKANNNPV
ncbi:hypothetical protein CPB84DRAFT_1853893 [Gymnopilus junonius]|uniref:Uncharacterized protein n=1 Tax=Gymnopilus junonius TaxID=109634 RepID=A0A9P5N987_GYMJU|nr:hypothetical protein CPB84DRAFT_1853893 [Gymnopilus junonius]